VAVADELSGFVREALARGESRQSIENVLRAAGWGPDQVRAALEVYAEVAYPVPVPRPRPSLSARETFLYLLQFTTLYLVAFNFGSLIFQFIDRAFPDPLDPPADLRLRYAVRGAVSMLIVAGPVFLLVSRLIAGTIRRAPAKRASPIRQWLTYLTLFVAACVLIGDVVALIYSLLGGELTVRFVAKALTIAAIAGIGFWYYLSGLRADEEARP
jgi:hypothetical protein